MKTPQNFIFWQIGFLILPELTFAMIFVMAWWDFVWELLAEIQPNINN